MTLERNSNVYEWKVTQEAIANAMDIHNSLTCNLSIKSGLY